jgi:hypothetical protein
MPDTPKIPRILTFDLMRGFFLIAIIITHLNLFPNLFDWWGMRGHLLVTTAEGFFLLSGVVLGIVRGAKLIDQPFIKVVKLVLHRAWTLYLTHIILVIGFTLLAWYIFAGNPDIKFGVMQDHSLLRLIWETVTMQYIYGWADYLRFYAIFIVLSPAALWLLRRGLWYLVILASVFIWLAFPISKDLPWESIALLQPIPWQVLFFSGLVIGFHWPQLSSWFADHKKALSRYVIPPFLIVAFGLLAINIFAVFAQEFVNNAWTRDLSYQAWSLRVDEFHKEILTPIRFILFMVWFWAWFIVVKKFENHIVKYSGWLLLPFGTNSLYVYTLHAIIVFFVHLIYTEGPLYANLFVTVGVVALIYIAIRSKFLMNIIPR